MKLSAGITLIALCLVAAACGNKGALVMPPPQAMDEAPPAVELPPPTDPTEADQPAEIPPPPAADPPADDGDG